MTLSFDRSNWESVSFGEVVKKVSNKINPESYHSEVVVEGGHINKRDFHIRDYANINELGYLGPAFHMGFTKHQILYVSRNPHLMKVGYPDFDGICANTTFILETKNENILRNDIIPFIMHSDNFIEQSVSNVRGGVNPYVNWGDLASIEFLLPPNEKQAEIAELLWSIDGVIQKQIKVLEKLNCLQKVKFKDLISGATGEMKPLSKFLKQKKTKSKTPHKKSKYIGLEHIKPGEIKCTDYGESKDIKAQCSVVERGDLCLSKLRPYLDKAFIATFDAVSTSELLIYDTDKLSKEYILYNFHSENFINYVSRMSYGTRMPRVNSKIIDEYQIKEIKNEDAFLHKVRELEIPIEASKAQQRSSISLQKSLINEIF